MKVEIHLHNLNLYFTLYKYITCKKEKISGYTLIVISKMRFYHFKMHSLICIAFALMFLGE